MYCYIIHSFIQWQPSIHSYNFIHLPIYPSIHSDIWWSPFVYHLIQRKRKREILLIQDLISLLHTASARIKLQVRKQIC